MEEKESLAESKGHLTAKIDEIARQEKEFVGFVEELTHAALVNTKDVVYKLRNQLSDVGSKRARK